MSKNQIKILNNQNVNKKTFVTGLVAMGIIAILLGFLLSNYLIPEGKQGIQGIQGIQGLKGETGDVGLQGVQGSEGMKGDMGTQGEQGLNGENGTNGIDGIDGLDGKEGLDAGIDASIGVLVETKFKDECQDTHYIEALFVNFGKETACNVTLEMTWTATIYDEVITETLEINAGDMLGHSIVKQCATINFSREGTYAYEVSFQ